MHQYLASRGPSKWPTRADRQPAACQTVREEAIKSQLYLSPGFAPIHGVTGSLGRETHRGNLRDRACSPILISGATCLLRFGCIVKTRVQMSVEKDDATAVYVGILD